MVLYSPIEIKVILSAENHPLSFRSDDDSAEHRIVEHLSQSGECIFERVDTEVIHETLRNGCHTSDTIYVDTFALRIPEGLCVLSAIKDEQDQRRRHARKEANDNAKSWIIPIVSAIIGSALTLLVEHFDSFVAWFSLRGS